MINYLNLKLMKKILSYDKFLSEETKKNIIEDYSINLLSLNQIGEKYNISSSEYLRKLLKGYIRSISESGKIAHKTYPNSFKHSEETKAKIRALRLAYMKAHPEKTAWRKKNLSYPEQQFIKFLQEYGYDKKYHIERELSIFPFFVDFAFTDQKIAIEIDGSQHLLPERKAKDDEKDALLIEQGWKVIRFTENLVKTDWNTIHETLSNYLNDKNVSDSISVGIFKSKTQHKNINKKYTRLTENGPTQKQLESWSKQRKVLKEPIKEDLIALLDTHSMTDIGKIYGVSEAAMRKWYKKFNIEYRKKILHKKKVIKKICPICGKIFEQSYKSQKYCSKECALSSKSKKPDLQHFFSQTHVFGILAKEYGVDLKTIRNWFNEYKQIK